MRYLSILLLFFALLTNSVYAKEKKTKQNKDEQTIEELVKEIKSNPINRRLAINRLKIRLRNMNIEIRRKIMLDLQHTLGGHTIQPTHTSSEHVNLQHETTQQPTPVSTPTTVPGSIPTSPPTSVPTSMPTSVPIPTSVPTSIPTSVPVPTSVPTSMPHQISAPFHKT